MLASNEQTMLVDNIHVFDDNNKYTELDNDNEQQLQVIETVVTKQQTNTAIDSEVCSTKKSKMVNFDHLKEFQECMDTYEIYNGVESFETIAMAIAFYESSYNLSLTVMKSSANHYRQYSCKQHSGCNFHVSFDQHHGSGLLHQKKCNFLHSGSTMEVVAKGGRKWKKRRKGHFQQSYLLAGASTHHSVLKLAIIRIMAGNYQGEGITYNMSWRKLQEVEAVSKKVARKAFELVIPFLEDWKEIIQSHQ